jgi:hypothetical protein
VQWEPEVSLAFPTLPSGSLPDSKQFAISLEDPAMRTEMEGGYVITRKKHTRTPRRTWAIAYQMLTEGDRTTLDDFWNTTAGGSLAFDWTNPADGSIYTVRFKDPLNFKYAGIGTSKRWDCSFSLEQA